MSGELPHIRCITCNKVLAHKWEKYQEMISQGVKIETALNELGLERPCCRLRMRNPFKVVDIEPQTQDDLDLMVQSGLEKLSLKKRNKAISIPALASASDLSDVQSSESGGMMIQEDEDEDEDSIELPDIPQVDTTNIPGTVRSYRAW